MINRTASSSLAIAASLALWSAPALAQDTNTSPDAPVSTTPVTANGNDIIVTATKRNERLRDVPIPVSVVTGDQLAKANANSLSDYITRLPGVVFNDYQPGISEVVIRGVAATTYHEQGQTTTGYYLNEVPLEEPGFPIVIPDVDTFDLDRVEVLRGPQGTLFGSSTLGGLVNYTVKTADPSALHGAAEGLVGSTKNANGQLNYAGKLMLNVPIVTDKLAVRVMGLQRVDAGYLDNIGTGRKGSNDLRTRGVRGSIVWTPSPDTKITYLGTYQDTRLDDQTYLSAPKQLIRDLPREEPQKTSFFLNTLRLDQDVGFANFTAFGSVDKKTNTTIFSYPYLYVTGVTAGTASAYDRGDASANIKTFETRLASKGDGPFKWLIGFSYLHARKASVDHIIQGGAAAYIDAHPADFGGYSGATLASGDAIYGYTSNTKNTDWGIFGEASYKPIEQLEITLGGRYYNTRNSAVIINAPGSLGAGSFTPVASSFGVKQKEDGFTPKATIAYRPNTHTMIYATYSKGFREGGPNPNAAILPGIPQSYGSDKVDNYEIGVKTETADRRFSAELTGFHIDWKNIQAREFTAAPYFYSYVINAGGARINGIEFTGTAHITRELTFSSNATYEDAKLSKFLPYAFAADGLGFPKGTRLPGASKWSVANNLAFDIPGMRGEPTIELAHRYLSRSPVAFGSTFDRGGFNLFDARASITVAQRFRLLGFVNNIFNKYGILNGPFASEQVPAYSITRPRTYGLRVDVGF
jgi:outer membrane receptor protein involved in Fe transport